MLSQRVFLAAGIGLSLVATAIAYAGVMWNDFVEFDDNVYVTGNPHTLAGLSVAGARYAFTTLETGNWIPLVWLSFQLDSTLFGMRPMGFHATNLALHLANTLLFFFWMTNVTGSRGRSLAVSVLFGLHPLHVESVAWVSERKDVLCAFWLFLTLLTYTKYATRPSFAWYLATCVCLTLGLMSKSMLVTVPLLLLLIDVWPLNRVEMTDSANSEPRRFPTRPWTVLILEKVPMLLLSLLAGLITLVAATTDRPLMETSLLSRIANALQSYAWYIGKTLLPIRLSALYPYSLNAVAWDQIPIPAAVLSAVSIYAAINGVRRPYLLFGWFWFLISLLPVIGLTQVGYQSHADRYSYIPHVGLLLAIVWEGNYWLTRFSPNRAIGTVTVTVAAIACAFLTTQQVAVWRNTETLWTHAVEVDPENWYAHGALGNICLSMDRIEEASKHFECVVKQRPEEKEPLRILVDIFRRYPGKLKNTWQFCNELGLYRARENDFHSAVMLFQRAVKLAPDKISSRNNLALALSRLGRDNEAMSHLETVLLQKPNDANAHMNLGVLYRKTNQLTSARDHLSKALEFNPADHEAREHLNAVERNLRQKSDQRF